MNKAAIAKHEMSIPKVLPMINSLSYSDKFQLVQMILSQLAKEQGIDLKSNQTFGHSNSKPQPIGKVYYSGRSDVSLRASQILFQEKVQSITQRNKS